ncbi:MAG: MBL fold metallo-hydrolase [Lachnospiraceae bacterium]|nr:MBL fold metallo-hydrolase [Lachnospiraceae bacterium]
MIKFGRLFHTAVLIVIVAIAVILGGCTGGNPGDGAQESENGSSSQDGSNGQSNNGNGQSNNGNGQGSSDQNGTGDPSDAGTAKCEIIAFSIGKADSILISSGNVNILIDTGEEDDAEYICDKLKERGVGKLDLIVVTHFDKDHAGGFPKILQEFGADNVYYPDYADTRDPYMAFRRAISDRGNDGKITANTEYAKGSIRLAVYPETNPKALREKSDDYENDMSLVCMLYFKDYRFFFAGDIEKERTDEILEAAEESAAGGDSGIDLACDWIKMPHHGRYNKKLKKLLDACSPSYAVVTDSDDQIAETDTLIELQKRKVKTFSTRNGEVVTTIDESGISVENRAE